jgi:hypothetical protein
MTTRIVRCIIGVELWHVIDRVGTDMRKKYPARKRITFIDASKELARRIIQGERL